MAAKLAAVRARALVERGRGGRTRVGGGEVRVGRVGRGGDERDWRVRRRRERGWEGSCRRGVREVRRVWERDLEGMPGGGRNERKEGGGELQDLRAREKEKERRELLTCHSI